MGCSPSKGQLFAGIYNHQDKALQFGSHESNSDYLSDGTEIKSQTETGTVSTGLTLLEEESTPVPLQGKRSALSDVVCDTTTNNRAGVDIVETNVHSQAGLLTQEQLDRKDARRMKNNGCKRNRQKEKLKKTVYIQSNLDLPEAMVKAHQAAYAYLNHNIPKYESLLGLMDKTTQTQLSLQPMVTVLPLRYEEINQALEEIATEGEQMLEMYGNHMAWSAAQRDVLLNPDIPEAEMNSIETPPDLLQHMLHHAIEKMRLVGASVKCLGDTSLEETADYFGSLSQLLAEKLMAKRAAEVRLKQVLACVEASALRKPCAEDSTLHSEDSGIGADNECHNGSAQLRSHRDDSRSGTSTSSSYGCPEGSSPDQPYVNEVEEGRNEEVDDDKDNDAEYSNEDEEAKDEQGSKTDQRGRKISIWSQGDPSQHPLQVGLRSNRLANIAFDWTDKKERNIRRPKTADNSSVCCQGKHSHSCFWGTRRSRSADCLCSKVDDYMVQGQDRLQNDNQKPKWINKGQNPTQCYGLQYGNKGPFNAGLPPSLPPAFAPVPPGRNAVRRLINTFSQGVQDSSNQKPLNGPTRFRGNKRYFLPIITNCRAGVSTNGNNNNNSYPLDQRFSKRPEDVDVESLPPPPPEVLMDNSFESNEGPIGDEEGSETLNQMCVTQRQKCGTSQHLRASLQTVSLLPSRASISRDSLNILPACHIRQDSVVGSQPGQIGVDSERKKAVGIYQQSQKIIHLCHSSDSPAMIGSGDEGIIRPLSERVGATVRLGNRDSREGEAAILDANSLPPTTSSVSRAQIPPSSYSTCHIVLSPPSLPLSPTCPVNGQGEASTVPSTSRIQRWTRRGSDEENGFLSDPSSMSFYDAHSMFCQETQSASQSLTASCRSTLPRPWGEPSRGKLQVTRLPQTFTRRSPYRPTLTDQRLSSVTEPHIQDSEVSTVTSERKDSVAETAQCSEQEISTSCSVFGSQEAEPREITDKKD